MPFYRMARILRIPRLRCILENAPIPRKCGTYILCVYVCVYYVHLYVCVLCIMCLCVHVCVVFYVHMQSNAS